MPCPCPNRYIYFTNVISAKKSFIGQNKSIWGPLELVEKLCPESANIATSARDLPGIRYALIYSSKL